MAASSAAIEALSWSTLRLLLVDELLGGDVLHHQRLGAGEILLGGAEQSDVLHPLGLGLVERGLEQARIDPRQHVALFHVLAFGEQHLLHDAVDLGMDPDGEGGLHGAEPGGIDRHVLPGGHRDAHPHRRARRRPRQRRRSPVPGARYQ